MNVVMRRRWLVVPAVALMLAGCSSSDRAAPPDADLAPIVVADASVESQPSPSPSPSVSVTGEESPVTDPRADLDIDDQVGDGRTVVVEAVETDLSAVHLVIETRDGRILGSDLITAGLQPVTLRLDQAVPEPMELVGRILADNGDGILEVGIDLPVVDDEGEHVTEDFNYVFIQEQLADD